MAYYTIKSFGVIRELRESASTLCSNFYLLYELVENRGVEACRFDFKLLKNQLDYIFQRYILYVSARESRHVYTDMAYPPDMVTETEDDFPEVTQVASTLTGGIDKEAFGIEDVPRHIFRTYKNTKKDIIRYCRDLTALFSNGYWDTDFGGDSWAKITNLLIRRLEGNLSKALFVDYCWHTEHNSAHFLNKVVGADELDDLRCVLDLKQGGYFKELLSYSDLDNKIKALIK